MEVLMKDFEDCIVLWRNKIPPNRFGENDFILKLEITDSNNEERSILTMISWCDVQKLYYIEPVEAHENGQYIKAEAWFTNTGFAAFKEVMQQIEIKDFRRIFNTSKLPLSLDEQLTKIHPAFSLKDC